MSRLFLENYWINEELGRGNLGFFYRAVRTVDGVTVCMQKIDLPVVLLESQKKQRFEIYKTEMSAVCRLDHPHLIKTYKFFEEKGNYYNETELIGGKNLKAYYEKKLSLTYRQSVLVFSQIAQALEYAHSQNVVHQNISPASIYIDGKGGGRLTEFGTHVFNYDSSLKEVAASFSPPRYIDYLAPEQLKPGKYDGRVDVYGLCAVMYEHFAGFAPFCGADRNELEQQIQREFPKPLPELNSKITDSMNKLILKGLSKDPGKRFAHAGELACELKRIYDEEEISDEEINISRERKIEKRVAFSIGSFIMTTMEKTSKLKNRIVEKANSPLTVPAKREPVKKTKAEKTERKTPEKSFKLKPPSSSSLLFIVITAFALLLFYYFGSAMARSKPEKNPESPLPPPVASESETSGPPAHSYNGKVIVKLNKPGAYVYLNNIYDTAIEQQQQISPEDGTPLVFEVPPGTYVLKAARELHRNYETRVDVVPGGSKTVEISLEEKTPMLQVITEPANASVFLNDVLFGRTPMTLYDANPGEFHLIISKKGYQEKKQLITLAQGNPVFIEIKLDPAVEAKPSPSPALQYTQHQLDSTYISLFSKPSGATVKIGEKELGVTPLLKTLFPPGKFKMAMEKKDYLPKEIDVEIIPSKTNNFQLVLEPDPEATKEPVQPLSTPTAVVADPIPKKPGQKASSDVTLMPKFIFFDGFTYDKLNRHPVTFSYDREHLEKFTNSDLSRIKGIKVTDSGFDADLILTFRFSIGENPESNTKQPDLILYAAALVTDLRQRVVYYKYDEMIKMPYPPSWSIDSRQLKTNTDYVRFEFFEDRTATQYAEQFIKNCIPRIASEVAKYDPQKHSTKEDHPGADGADAPSFRRRKLKSAPARKMNTVKNRDATGINPDFYHE